MTAVNERSLDWETCPKHGTRFQKGSCCPKCQAEQPK
jgi:hypothetical protein